MNKELYRELRRKSRGELWNEISLFNQATPEERSQRVSLIRAVGVVFSETGSSEECSKVRHWLLALIKDPDEKIRRYAMAALPKIGSGSNEEAVLLELFRKTQLPREKGFLSRTLNKIGGDASLKAMGGDLVPETEQKLKANIARTQSPSSIQISRLLGTFKELRINLRGRRGLENLVRDEVEDRVRDKFKLLGVQSGLVTIAPTKAFSLADIYQLRCFGTVGFVLGLVKEADQKQLIEAIAAAIASEKSRDLFQTFTEGAIRYRLNFPDSKSRLIRAIADRAYSLCPLILNDARSAPWVVDVQPAGEGSWVVELRPRLSPDPRWYYRQDDIPAASHPPLAACMARLAGKQDQEVIWDPFCGSGLELVERALIGGVRVLHGTDRSEPALVIARANFAAARLKTVQAIFAHCDFRDFDQIKALGGLRGGSVSLIITNPPMGKRVPIPNLHGLIQDLFSVADRVLRPGGRLVFANPLHIRPRETSLKLQSRQVVDFGGFDCRLEKYVKIRRMSSRLGTNL